MRYCAITRGHTTHPGAVPVMDRGLLHTAPTYIVGLREHAQTVWAVLFIQAKAVHNG